MLKTLTGWDKTAIMNGVDSHVTNCDMFLNYDNSTNKIRKMSTNATANCVNDEEEKERASTLSNNFKEEIIDCGLTHNTGVYM